MYTLKLCTALLAAFGLAGHTGALEVNLDQGSPHIHSKPSDLLKQKDQPIPPFKPSDFHSVVGGDIADITHGTGATSTIVVSPTVKTGITCRPPRKWVRRVTGFRCVGCRAPNKWVKTGGRWRCRRRPDNHGDATSVRPTRPIEVRPIEKFELSGINPEVQ